MLATRTTVSRSHLCHNLLGACQSSFCKIERMPVLKSKGCEVRKKREKKKKIEEEESSRDAAGQSRR